MAQKLISEEEIIIRHKEYLCENYKPILGQSIYVNNKQLMLPEIGRVSKCIRYSKRGNRCDLCNNFKEKE